MLYGPIKQKQKPKPITDRRSQTFLELYTYRNTYICDRYMCVWSIGVSVIRLTLGD